MIIDSEILGFVILHTEKELPSKEEIELLQTLSNDLAFAVKSIEIDKAKKRAFEQINKNIEQFAILIDGIRNPLAIILGLTELRTDDDTKAIIMEQIKKIEMILKRLDEGWLDSEEMRDFLKRFEK
jgi:two-component system response regulator